MVIVLKVTWVDQSGEPELHQRIRHIGGVTGQLRWKHTQAQAVESIERNQFVYYVEKGARALSLNVGRSPDGRKYLTIPDDGGNLQLLLKLPGFPRHVQPQAETS
jgi:Protein of unknown function (DUF3892)